LVSIIIPTLCPLSCVVLTASLWKLIIYDFLAWKEAFCSQNSNCSRWFRRSIVLKAMGVIPVRIKNSGKVTNVSSLSKDSFTALMHHDPSYLGPLILTHHLKGIHIPFVN